MNLIFSLVGAYSQVYVSNLAQPLHVLNSGQADIPKNNE